MDYTKIILAVIALINAVLTTFLIPWLKQKTDAEEVADLCGHRGQGG